MPQEGLRAYIDQLPRIHAIESLRRIRDGIVASGRLKRPEMRRIIRQLEREARVHSTPRRFATPEDGQAALMSIGIGVEMRKRSE